MKNMNTGLFKWTGTHFLMLCATAIFSLISLSVNALGSDTSHVYSGRAIQQNLKFTGDKPKFQPKNCGLTATFTLT